MLTEKKPDGSIYSYEYDLLNKLTKVYFQNSSNEQRIILKAYSYSILSDRKTQKTETVYLNDSETSTTVYTYDYAGRLVSQVNPDGGVLSTVYNANGTIHSSKNAMGKSTYYKYDGLNRLTEQWAPFGDNKYTYTSFTYDKNGNITTEKTGIESVSLWGMPYTFITTSYTYKNNQLISKTDAEGGVTKFEYDANGNIHKETVYFNESDAKVTEYEYNHLGKIVRKIQYVEAGDIYGNAFGDTTEISLITNYTYDANGNIKSVTTPDNIVTTYEYDNLDRMIKQTVQGLDEYGQNTVKITSITYDYAGNILTKTDPKGNVTLNEYNRRGLLIRTIDPAGGITAYYYDNAGRLISKVSPANYIEGAALSDMSRAVYTYDKMNRIILEQDIYLDEKTNIFKTITANANKYDLNGNIIKSLDALGYESGTGTSIADKINTGYGTNYTYNDANLLLTSTSPVTKDKGLAFDVSYTYDAAGRKISETDANNKTKKFYYNGLGRITKASIVDSTEKVLLRTTYDRMGNILTQMDGNGNITSYSYNRLGLLRSRTNPGDESIDSYAVNYQYNMLGQLALEKDNTGKVIIYSLDHEGNVLSKTVQSEGGTQKITVSNAYDKNGNLRFATDGNGSITEYTYDGLDRVISTSIIVNGVIHTSLYSYDKNGNLLETTDWLGNTYTNSYDALNRLTKKTDPYGIVIEQYEYNNNHAQIKSIDALGNITLFSYDKNNRLLITTDPLGYTISQTYDNVGNIATKTDGNNNVTKYGYDALNRLITVTNAKSEVTSYTYDLNGNKLTQTDARGNVITFTYNAANLLVDRIEPKDATGISKKDSYTYYPNGTVKTKTDKNGNVFSYTYDINGNLLAEVVGNDTILYTYDNNGNLLTMTDVTGTTIRTYDELGRVLTKTVPHVGTISFEYDITDGQDTGYVFEKSIDPMGNVTEKVYDKAGRLSEVIVGDDITIFSYYDNGSRESIVYSDGSKEEYTYYSNNKIKSLVNRRADGSMMDIYQYTYDKAGNQLSKHEVINETDKGKTIYTYDSLNRLATVTEPNGRLTSYTYDKVGNRLTETITYNGSTTINTYTYNNQNRLTDITTKVNNVITEVTSYTYDYNGNQLTTAVKSYNNGALVSDTIYSTNNFDYYNQLIKTVTSDGTIINNSYNSEGYRVIKEVDGTATYYLYEFDKVILEINKDGDQVARNVYGFNLLMRTVDDETYYYMYNGHADVTALIASDGTLAATYYYDAFGNILESTGSVNNNILYSGYQYDKETELYYLNARMYDPKIARFLQQDTYAGDLYDPLSLNLYTYCGNNPIIYWDPTGHTRAQARMHDIAAGSATGVAITIVITYILLDQLQEKDNKLTDIPGDILKSTYSANMSYGIHATNKNISSSSNYVINADSIAPTFDNAKKTSELKINIIYKVNADNMAPSDIAKAKKDTNQNEGKESSETKEGTKTEGAENTKFPDTPEEMDELLGQEGKEIPDGPNTQGRNKVKWKLPDGTEVTYEQHPYDVGAPEYHTEPHYHVSIPGEKPHITFRPGDQIPFMK